MIRDFISSKSPPSPQPIYINTRKYASQHGAREVHKLPQLLFLLSFDPRAKMNSSLATLAVFLVAAMFLSHAQAQFEAKLCCFNYVKKPIPQKNLRSFEYTSARCSMHAVVFITHMNRQMCADPNAQWVQDRVKYLSQN
ncbi:C-C motif chemokine 5, partial [Ophiophagus hannah]